MGTHDSAQDAAEEILRSLRDREWRDLEEHADRVLGSVGPQPDVAAPRDPARHLVRLGRYDPESGRLEPVSLRQEAAALRRALDDPEADRTAVTRDRLTIEILREFATRLLIAHRRGEVDDPDDGYARAISDLAVALSLRHSDSD